MCNIPPQTCPQDPSIVLGNVVTECFLKGAMNGSYEFKSPKDLANPALMKAVFRVQDGSENSCSARHYTMKLPKTEAEALAWAEPCTVGQLGGFLLPQGCVGNNPKASSSTQAKCCAGNISNIKLCPKGYCINNDTCGQIISNWCTQNGIGDKQCQDYIKNSKNDSMKIKVVNDILNQLIKKPYGTDLKNNPFKKDIVKLCSSAPKGTTPPGACDTFLNKYCKKYTREDLGEDEDLAALCGCHLDPTVYNKYKQMIVPGGTLQKECDPACFNGIAIRQGTGACKKDECTQAVCVINFKNKDVQKLIQEGIDIDQNCYGKPDQGNLCVFSLTVDGAKELKEKNIKVSQNCGSCGLWDPNNPNMKQPAPIDCKNIQKSIGQYYKLPANGGKPPANGGKPPANGGKPPVNGKPPANGNIWVYAGVGLIIFIILVGLIIFLLG